MNALWIDVALNEMDLLQMEKDTLQEGLAGETNEVVKIGINIRLDLVACAMIKLESWIRSAVLNRDTKEFLASNMVTIEPLKTEQ